MGIIVGIDIGGSTTKICGFSEEKKLIDTFSVKSSDPVASVYGAFGKFTTAAGIELTKVKKVMVTGVGSKYVKENIYGIPTERINEFKCIGIGGRYMAGFDEALVVSMGTGTAMVYSDKTGSKYLGGTGVGGGTIVGLSKAMIDASSVVNIESLAKNGDLSKVNLRISDITEENYSSTLSPNITAANFGKLSDMTTREDKAAGILNLVFETVGMMSVFASKSCNTKNIVMVGHLSESPKAKEAFDTIGKMFDLKFNIPENGQFGTVIGAALQFFGE